MNRTEEKVIKIKLLGSYVTTIISITLVLFVIGIVGILFINSSKISDYAKENIGFTIFLKNNIKDAEVKKFQKQLDISEFVKQTEYVTKEKAADELKEDLGEDFIDYLGYNPLYASIDIVLKSEYANLDSLQKIEKQLSKNQIVKEVYYQKSLVQLVEENVRKINILLLSFGFLMFLISITLINNTIRLTVFARRFLIRTMQLVGATEWFITRPFVLSGVIYGFVSSLLSIAMLIVFIYFMQQNTSGIIFTDGIEIVFILLILCGIFISGLTSYFAVNKSLKTDTDQLYYY